MKTYNFSAGPAMLPREVMEKAQKEFCAYGKSGCGIIELSHRGTEFTEIIQRTEKNIRELMNIGDDYAVLFIQGGASLQFAMVPLNLAPQDGMAQYVDSGHWASAAIKEAKNFINVETIASSKDTKYDRIPDIDESKISEKAAYLHITSNNTIYGTQYHSFPESPIPLVADMSSDIMSRVIDINSFGLIYAGAQKNLGPSGVTLVIIKKSLADRLSVKIPTMLKYKTYIDSGSLYNTPPTFAIYMVGLVTEWLKAKGGIEAIEEINDAKSEALYERIEGSDFYSNPVEPASRSRMNVVFRLPTEELEEKFVKEAKAKGLIGLKGHRSVGGLRASIYNAMPLEGVEALIDFMNEFESANS